MKLFQILALSTLALTLAGCKTACCDAQKPQMVVDSVAAANDGCTRLTLHCRAVDGDAKVCASTDAARVGTASDPEDLKAMQSGETVVLEEGDALDVTVPLMQTDGQWTTVCGVTLTKQAGATREQTVAAAEAIAAAVKAQLGDCCPNGACCESSGSTTGNGDKSCCESGASCCEEGDKN